MSNTRTPAELLANGIAELRTARAAVARGDQKTASSSCARADQLLRQYARAVAVDVGLSVYEARQAAAAERLLRNGLARGGAA